MRDFYDCLCVRWPELLVVSFDSTFCRFLKDGGRKISGFRVTKAHDLPVDEIERRLPLTALPALAVAAPHGITPAAVNPAVEVRVRVELFFRIENHVAVLGGDVFVREHDI